MAKTAEKELTKEFDLWIYQKDQEEKLKESD